MKKISIDEIKPGMILAEDIVSPKGQKLAKAGSMIMAQQLLHISYYNINEIAIQDEEEALKNYQYDAPDDFIQETQSWKILNSMEFKEFQLSYDKCVEHLELLIDDFVKKQIPLDDEALLEEIRAVFKRHQTGMGIMAMLVNMQGMDRSTYQHSINVAIISRVFGTWMKFEDPKELDVLTMSGLYHDIGKTLVPQNILVKPGKLTLEEYTRMCEHPLLGYQIMKDQPIDRRIKLSAAQHHERCDGSGYPYGLKKDFIADFARMVAIADVYDAMTADRCYRAGICPFEVIAEFQRLGMEKYDMKYLHVFLQNIAESYVGSGVLLSDNSRGIITMVKKNALASPLVKLEDGSFIDLTERRDMFIKACI